MFKKISLIIGLLAIVFSGYSQESPQSSDTKFDKILGKLSITPQVGLLHFFGDVRSEDAFTAFSSGDENELGLGIYTSYTLTDYLVISGGLINGKLTGIDRTINSTGAANEPRDLGKGIMFRTNVTEVYLPRVDFNVSRFLFKDNYKFFNKVSFNIFASHGLVQFNSKVYALNDEDVNLIYYKDRGRTGVTTEAVTSIGSSVSYIVNSKLDIGLETSLRNVHNDKLDAWPSDGSANDKLSFTALNITYYLKKREYIVKDFDLSEEPTIEEGTGKVDEVAEETQTEEDSIPVEEKVEPTDDEIANETNDDTTVSKDDQQDASNEVVDTEPADKEVEETETTKPQISPTELYEGHGNFVSVAAFRSFKVAQIQAKKLVEKGESPMIVENRTKTWFIVAIDRHDELDPALESMKAARKSGYSGAWVLVKPKK